MNSEPESLMLQLLRHMQSDIADMRGQLASKTDVTEVKTDLGGIKADIADVKNEMADLKSDMHSLRADAAADFITTRKDFSEKIVGLRRAVVEYHTSVIGHGILISDLEARIRRVEQHLNLNAPDQH